MTIQNVAVAVIAGAIACGLSGCDKAEDYGWFKYTAPDGWKQYEPPPGITLAAWAVEFIPDEARSSDQPRLEVWKITDELHRSESVAAIHTFTLERSWRALCADAAKSGEPLPAFECTSTPANIVGDVQTEAFDILLERDGKKERRLVYFIETPDGRRFRVTFRGAEAGFSQYREAIVSSLESLSFPASEPKPRPLTRSEVVAALKQQLDGTRLWLNDGRIAGRRLNDELLAALTDPTFAGVTDLNLVSSGAAISSGVDVTDAGLAHIAHLPLKSLCLRGSLVTDAGLFHLKNMPLETLVLSHTLVEGDGLQHLRDLPLKVLDLDNTRVSDVSLAHLETLPLVQLWLRHTRCTDAGLARIEKVFPKVLVSH